MIFYCCLLVMDSITSDALRLKSFLIGSAWIWDGLFCIVAGYGENCNSAQGKYSLCFLYKSVQSVYKSSLCLGAGRKELCTAHGSSFVGLCQQTKVICWNKKRSLWAKVLGQSSTNCLNCSIKHLVSTFNSQETFKWCLWKSFFSNLSICICACMQEISW